MSSSATVPAAPSPTSVASSRLVPGYDLLELLGSGAYGRIYLARRKGTPHLAAAKLLLTDRPSEAGLAGRLEEEARVLACIRHPHVVSLYDSGPLDGGGAYLTMEYVQGRSLKEEQWRCGGRLPLPAALDLAEQIAEGLDAVHRQGVLHRDIKPENILLSREPESGTGHGFVKILDFGSALRLNAPDGEGVEAGGPSVVAPRTLIGTPFYMAPEQIRFEPLDARVDVYALGVLLYEMLSGCLPYDSDELTELQSGSAPVDQLLRAHLFRPLVPLGRRTTLQPVPEEVEQLMARALARDPADRLASMELFLEGLRNCRQQSQRAASSAVSGPRSIPARSRLRVPLLVAGLLVTGLLAAGLLLIESRVGVFHGSAPTPEPGSGAVQPQAPDSARSPADTNTPEAGLRCISLERTPRETEPSTGQTVPPDRPDGTAPELPVESGEPAPPLPREAPLRSRHRPARALSLPDYDFTQ